MLLLVISCSGTRDRKIAEDKESNRSKNIFTGSETVSTEKETTYQDRNTGDTYKRKSTSKVKYDRNGNKISESYERDTDGQAR